MPRPRIRDDEQLRWTAQAVARLRVGVLCVDPEERIQAANPAALRLLGTGFEAAVGQPWRGCLPSPAPMIDIQPAGAGQQLVFLSQPEPGPIDRVHDALAAMLHELRNPLAAITTTAEVLLEGIKARPVEDVERTLTMILEETQRLSLVLRGMGTGQQSLRTPTRLAVRNGLVRAVSIMAARMTRRRVRLQPVIAPLPDLPFQPAGLEGLVFNLLNNALQASPPDAVVKVHIQVDGADLRIDVIDEGVGMSEAVRARCLEPFFSTRPSGSGLGLSLCAAAIDEAGGTLHIQSTQGRGTSVHVLLPIGG
jgi:two-component system NtrC family sensor kinase